ncbi:MAG: autotransporter domain-containing protein [Endomicrobium sp.]|jgi:predicted outer membrane repeat protein|nr:autotransporter domain-containing protein [Endomicrobium sp.]
MRKILKFLVFLYICFLLTDAQADVYVSSAAGLSKAISDNESGILVQNGGFSLGSAINIANYPAQLHIRADSTAANFFGSSYGQIFVINASSITFQDINFKNMQGNIFIESKNSSLNFNNTIFENNDSGFAHSAFMFDKNSKVNFNEKTEFADNKGRDGGGFHTAYADMTFNGKTAFINNKAESGGGFFSMGIYDDGSWNRSAINFNEEVIFASNTASLSGGGFFVSASGINFKESIFKYNKAKTDGGAGIVSGASVNFGGVALFEKNKSDRNGGALYITMNYVDTVDFQSTSEFKENNSGGSGGAIYMYDSVVNLKNANFTGNKAGENGGAVFLRGDAEYESYAQLNINTVNNSASDNKTIFQGNMAASESNALYLAEYSRVTFMTNTGASVEIYDGINSDTNTAFMVIKGAGNFNLYADASLYNLELNTGNFNLGPSSRVEVINLDVDKDSVLNMRSLSASNLLNVKNFNFDGTLKVDGNKIVAVTTKLGANSRLDIQTDAAVNASKNYRKRYYKILNYETLNGSFGYITLNNGLSLSALSVDSSILNIDNWLVVSLKGNDTSTKFSEISGLSYNQMQVAKTFDSISSRTISFDLDEQISAIEVLDNDDLKKSAFLDASGYFLANIIRSAAFESGKQDIYNRIRYQDINTRNVNGIWVQATVQNSEIDEDENSADKYKDYETGALSGWDIMFDDYGFLLGVYGKYAKHHIQQDLKNEAVLEGFGAGIYMGILKDDWEIKSFLSAGRNNFVAERYINYASRTAESDFSAMTVSADFEGAIRSYVTEAVLLRPFTGIEFKNVAYDSFNEKNAGGLSLNVNNGNYSRSTARIGLSVGSDEDVSFEWYAAVEGKYLLTDETSEIISSFAAAPDKFTSKGAKEGSTIISFGAGSSYRILHSFKIFANMSYQYSDGYHNIYTSAGIRAMID